MKIPTVKIANCSKIPLPRSGHRCTADETNLYCFGGYSPHCPSRVFSELWRFNFSTKTWHFMDTTGRFPEGVASAAVVLHKGSLIVFGGANEPLSNKGSEVSICVLRLQRWLDDPYYLKHFQPSGVYGHSLVLSPDNCLYVFGGYNGFAGFTSDLFSFNLSKSEYFDLSDLPNAPLPRYRHEAVSDGDKFYVIGGGNYVRTKPSGMYSLATIHSFSYKDKMWNEHECRPCKLHGFPKPRRCHACVMVDSTIYLCGGYDGKNIFDDIWSLCTKAFIWTKLEKVLPYPIYFHSAAVTPHGCLFVFGGSKGLEDDAPRSNEVHKLWLKTAPLLEMCWERILDLLPHISKLPSRALVELGIPVEILARLN